MSGWQIFLAIIWGESSLIIIGAAFAAAWKEQGKRR